MLEKQKRLDPIRNCVISISTSSLHTRTAKLYSEQGNTAPSELMVIDHMLQCKVCKRHSAGDKVFVERDNSASDMFASAVCSGESGQEVQQGTSVKQAKNTKPQSITVSVSCRVSWLCLKSKCHWRVSWRILRQQRHNACMLWNREPSKTFREHTILFVDVGQGVQERNLTRLFLHLRCKTILTLALHLYSCAFSCTTHQVVFRYALALFIFSSTLFFCEIKEPGWKQTNPWCAEKHILVATHLSQISIHITDTDGALSYTRSLTLLLMFDCWSISLLK